MRRWRSECVGTELWASVEGQIEFQARPRPAGEEDAMLGAWRDAVPATARLSPWWTVLRASASSGPWAIFELVRAGNLTIRDIARRHHKFSIWTTEVRAPK